MAVGIKFAFHFIVVVINLISIIYDFVMIEDEGRGFGGKLKYLTNWCIILQSFYFAVAAIIDVTETASEPQRSLPRTGLHKFKDLFHSIIAFPVAAFVAVTFWILYSVDTELVHSKELDDVIPAWLNHVMHTTIVPFIVVDKIVDFHVYPRRFYGILVACGLFYVYVVWILLIAYFDDFWVYPVLEHMRNQERAIFISICLAFFASFYVLGESLTTFIWGVRRRSKPTQKKVK